MKTNWTSARAWHESMPESAKAKKGKDMQKTKTSRKAAKPKIEHVSDDLGCTLLVQLPPVAPELRDFITYQTGQFVLGLINGLNGCVVPEDHIDYVNVDSM